MMERMSRTEGYGTTRFNGSLLSFAVDAVAAILVGIVFWLPQLPVGAGVGGLVPAIGLFLVVIVAVVLRWKIPYVGPIAAMAATLAGWVAGVAADPMLAAAWCLYPLALRRGPRTHAVTLSLLGVVMLVVGMASIRTPSPELAQRIVIAAGAIGVAWFLGHVEARRV